MTTHDLLLGLLKANLALSGGAIAVMLARKPARRAFGAGLTYSLWLTPILATAAVFAPARHVTMTVAAPAPAPLAMPSMPTALGPLDYAVTAGPASIDPWMIAGVLWVLGLVLMTVWLTLKQKQFMAQVRAGRGGPAVVGLIRPRIVTPADFEQRFTAREQAVVLAHEKVHMVRQDARINAFGALVRCVCWFNPMAHVAVFLMRIDQELACDAKVVERHPKARRPYAEAMLKAEFADRPLPLGCSWPTGTRHPLAERIAMLKLNRPTVARRIAGGGTLALLCGGAGLTAWASQPAEIRLVAAPHPAAAFTARAASVAPGSADRPVQVATAEPAPAPGFAPEPQTTASSGLGPATTVQGTLVGMGYKWPISELFLRDASGRQIIIDTDDSNNLVDDAMANGMVSSAGLTISVKAYPDPDGSRFYADPADFTADGAPLFANANAQPGLPAYLARRLKTCGGLPSDSLVGVGSRDPARQAIYDAWNSDCAAKLAKSAPAGGIPSIISNSVKRGIRYDQPPTEQTWREKAVETTATLRAVDWTGPRVKLHVVDDKTGQAWILLAGTPNTMLRTGVKPDQLSTGLSLRVVIDPQGGQTRCAQDCTGVAREIHLPDGVVLFVGGPGPTRTPV